MFIKEIAPLNHDAHAHILGIRLKCGRILSA